MTRPRPFVAALLLAVQLGGLAAWAPHAEPDGGPTGIHVEAAGTTDCPTPHDEGRCTVCHWLSQWRVVSPAPGLRPPSPRTLRAPLANLPPATDRHPAPSVLPRAPPTLVA